MFKHLLVLLAITATFAAAAAQSDTPPIIQPGDMVVDVIDNSQFEIFYELEGTAGELVVFQLVATEDDTELNGPEIVLYDLENNVIADTLSSFTFREATLAITLPQTGGYLLLVTREDGRAGEDFGEYRLQMIQPTVLENGIAVEGTAQNNALLNYYTVKQDAPFSVGYTFLEGELAPIVNAYRVNEGALVSIANLEGRELASGSIGLVPPMQETYVFTVGDSPFAINLDDTIKTVDYELRLTLPE
jgi:hypothetical protein